MPIPVASGPADPPPAEREVQPSPKDRREAAARTGWFSGFPHAPGKRGDRLSAPRMSHGWKPREVALAGPSGSLGASPSGPPWRSLTQRAPLHSQSWLGAAGRQGWQSRSPQRVRRWWERGHGGWWGPLGGSGLPWRGLEPPAGRQGAVQATWTLCGPQRPWLKAPE